MQVEIVSPDFTVTDAIRECVTQKVERALARFEPRLGRVHVGLADVNGPRHGPDKRCRMDCQINSLCRVSVEAVHEDLYAAIDSAAERIARAVSRHVGRRRSLAREAHARENRGQTTN